MHRIPHTGSVWDLDPADTAAGWSYEDCEAVFAAAFAHAFGRAPSHARTAGYLQRFFRFGVVPRWVLVYVREECHGISIANLGNAPVDPQIDLVLVFERVRAARAAARGRHAQPVRGVLLA